MLNFKTVNITAAVVFIGLLIVSAIYGISIWWFLIFGLLWLIVTGMGSAFIGWNYHITSINFCSKPSKNQIAITFDDGPNPEFTPRVLDLLEAHKAKATFFCIGKHIASYPEIFQRILDEGHTVGNHTFSHTNGFGFLPTAKVVSELLQTNAVAKKHSGLVLNLYRPAFGVTNPNIAKALKILGMQSIGWNKRSLDTTSISEAQILRRITKRLKAGDVILLHDTSEKSVRVLEQLLLFLRQKNLESVSVDSLCNIKAYA
ncbi:polysaccharide deacetylase family protein [Mangrovimonas xylaniphaga]|uniref:polysaccharide deacetylase family protein n=1 Tax=Mangrovimonas xylaniphaga TaxID=1645915 RepID=UPI0006B65B7E|nr:polysaccharide deacetylase family protein [Mangrovimonas xylaniphaga]